jgi:hypothetical protein
LGTAVAVVVTGAALAGLAGTGGFTLATAAVPHGGSIPASGPSGFVRGGFGGGPGGGAGGDTADTEVTVLLASTTSTWAAATVGSQTAASLQIASGRPVMAMGGFNGGDPAPTLAQFRQYVSAGKISYFVAGGRGGPGGGRGGTSEISSWVQENFTASTVGDMTVYDLRS